MPAPLRPIATATALALITGGCGTTASITRSTGPALEATIDRSDAEALYVTTSEGPRYRVARSDILAVRHPGNLDLGVAIVALAAVTLAGAFVMDPGDRSDESTRGSGFSGLLRPMALMGFLVCLPVGLVIGGTNLRSRSAAGSFTVPASSGPGSTPP